MTAPATRPHPRRRLDTVLHPPIRLSLAALLDNAAELEFAAVRDALQISDSTLSKQIAALESAGYLRARKGYVGKRPRTWLSLTAAGRAAYTTHTTALRAILTNTPPTT
jgi:DNA-binding MarR family transcriptional regulator